MFHFTYSILNATLFFSDFYFRHRLRPPSVNSSHQQPFAVPSVNRSLIQFTASSSVPSDHSPEMKKKGLDVLEEVCLASSKAETESNAMKHSDPSRPPIKIVLKPVKKCEINPPLRAKCEMQYSPPVNVSGGITGPSVHSVPDLRYPPAIEKAVLKTRSSVPQRRSDTGCPPMIKATSTEVNTVSYLLVIIKIMLFDN